jgi:uncharacterized membrane protein YsdA (DUF1294 family)
MEGAMERLNQWEVVALVYGVMAMATFIAYWRDKRAARRGRRRTRERTLHLLELLGGCIGGLFARPMLRHKTIDRRFRIVSWAILLLHLGAWLMYFIWRAKR